MLFKPLNTLTKKSCILVNLPQPDALSPIGAFKKSRILVNLPQPDASSPIGAFASMIGHYSKLAKRSPIPSLGAVSEACSVLSLQTVIVLWCVDTLQSGALMAVVSLVCSLQPS